MKSKPPKGTNFQILIDFQDSFTGALSRKFVNSDNYKSSRLERLPTLLCELLLPYLNADS